MPADTRSGTVEGQETFQGRRRSIITANETNQLKATPGRVYRLLVPDVGTSWQVDIYDNDTANANLIWRWVSADGKGPFEIDVPCGVGVRVVTSGTTPGTAVVVWD